MRITAVGLVLASIVASMSGCMGSGGSLDVAAPVWEAGYAFSFREFGAFKGSVSSDGFSETQDEDWGPYTNTFEVLNTTLEADGEPVYLAAYTVTDESVDPEEVAALEEDDDSGSQASMPAGDAMGTMSEVMFMGFRQRDLQSIPAYLEFSAECNNNVCTRDVGGLEFGDPPEWSFLEFPLTKGKKWSADVEVEGGNDFFGDIPIRFEARVNGVKTVSTPLGDVETIRVDYTMRPVDLDAYKKEVREEADDADVDLEKFDISLEQTGSLYYSEEYMTVVKWTERGDYSVEIKGQEGDEEFEFSSSGRSSKESALSGARLVARAERGLDYVLRLATGQASINDPTGGAPDRVKYALKIVADQTVVNAAESESIAFQAVVEGIPALPEGHTVKWTVSDANAKAVANGTGLEFTYAVAQPGMYDVVAEAFDAGGAPTTTNGVTVFGNYLATIAVECPPLPGQVGNNYRSMCEGVPVPVRPGVQYLRVSAQIVESPLGTLPVVNQAELFVGDRAGNSESDSTREGDEYVVELWMFWTYLVDEEDWNANLRHQRGVLEQVTYTVDVRYDAPPAGDMPVAPASVGLAESLDAWIGRR